MHIYQGVDALGHMLAGLWWDGEWAGCLVQRDRPESQPALPLLSRWRKARGLQQQAEEGPAGICRVWLNPSHHLCTLNRRLGSGDAALWACLEDLRIKTSSESPGWILWCRHTEKERKRERESRCNRLILPHQRIWSMFFETFSFSRRSQCLLQSILRTLLKAFVCLSYLALADCWMVNSRMASSLPPGNMQTNSTNRRADTNRRTTDFVTQFFSNINSEKADTLPV